MGDVGRRCPRHTALFGLGVNPPTLLVLNPYLTYHRAGMAFEDGAVLGECLSRLPNYHGVSKKSPDFLEQQLHALAVFEECRKQRTQMVVARGNVQQHLYHLHDGPEQEERDRKMQMVPTPEGEALAWRDPGLAPKLLGYDHIEDVRSPYLLEYAG